MSTLISMDGRISRSTYFWTTLAVMAITSFVAVVVAFVLSMTVPAYWATSTAGGLIALVGTVMIAFAAVKRLHDIGRPGTHYWLFLVPLYNVYLALMLMFQRGNDGTNRFGSDPHVS